MPLPLTPVIQVNVPSGISGDYKVVAGDHTVLYQHINGKWMNIMEDTEEEDNDDEDDNEDEDWEPEPHEVRYDIDTWNRELLRLQILVNNEQGLGFLPVGFDDQPNDLDLILMNTILEDEPGERSFEQWCRCILLTHVSGDISTEDMVLELAQHIDECQSDMEEGYPNLRILAIGVRWMEDYLTDADVFQKYANDYVYYRNWRQHIEDNQPIQQS